MDKCNNLTNNDFLVFYFKHNKLVKVSKKTFKVLNGPVIVLNKGQTKIKIFENETTRQRARHIIQSSFKAQSISQVFNSVIGILSLSSKIAKINPQLVMRITNLGLRLIDLICNNTSQFNVLSILTELYCIQLDFVGQSFFSDLMSGISNFLPTKWLTVVKFLQNRIFTLDNIYLLINLLLEWVECIASKLGLSQSVVDTQIKWIRSQIPPIGFLDFKIKLVQLLKQGRDVQIVLSTPHLVDDIIEFGKNMKVEDNPSFAYAINLCMKDKSLQKMLDDFSILYKTCVQSKNVSRQEPFMMVFEGSPGCFKSRSMTLLIKSLGRSVYSHVVPATKDTDKDFYDTYANQEIFYMDDVGQMGVGQWRKVMNWVSCVPLPLQCATASLKNTKFFTSTSILCTTNCFKNLHTIYRDDCIADLGALHRRGVVVDFYSARGLPNGDLSGSVSVEFFNLKEKRFVREYPAHYSWPSSLPLTFVCDDQFSWSKFIGWLRACFLVIENNKKLETGKTDLSFILKAAVEESQKYLAQNLLSDVNYIDSQILKSSALETMVYDTAIDKLRRLLAIEDNYGEPEKELHGIRQLYEMLRTSFINITTILSDWQSQTHNIIMYSLYALISLVTICCLWQCLRPLCKSGTDISTWSRSDLEDYYKQNNWLSEFNVIEKVAASSQEIAISNACGKCLLSHTKGTTQVFGVRSGRHIIVPYHTIIGETKVEVTMTIKDNVVYDKLPCVVDYCNSDEDVALLLIPKYNPISAKVIPLGGNKATTLLLENKIVALSTVEKEDKYGNIKYIAALCPEKPFVSKQGTRVMYNIQAPGMCGSPVVDSQNGIMGFHVSGNAHLGLGFSSLWSDNVLKSIKDIIISKASGLIPLDEKGSLSGLNVEVVESKYSSSVPKVSSIAPTEFLTNIEKVTRFPSDLQLFGTGTVIEVAKKSMQKTGIISRDQLEFCKKVLRSLVKPFGLLSDEQVIKGTPLLAGLNKKSTNGIGFPGSKDKYVDFEKGIFKSSINQVVEDEYSKLIQGEYTVDLWTWAETLKDELRNEEKGGVPRSFRVGTIVNQVLTKRVFGKMVEHIIENRRFNKIMVGMNPLKEWESMFKSISNNPTFAGDIGSWDGKMIPQLQHLVTEELSKLSAVPLAAEIILGNLVNTPVVILNKNVVTTHSMPSGSFLTAILNSIINRLYTAAWYYQQVPNPTLKDFETCLEDYVYGDDKVVVVKSHHDRLNALTMTKFFQNLEMDFTHSLDKKIKIDSPFQKISEITFLKRRFSFHPVLGISCPLDLRTLDNTIYFYDTNSDYESCVRGKLESIWRELHLHNNYLELTTLFLEKVKDSSVPWTRLSEEAIFDWVFSFDPDFLIKHY